MTVGLWITLAVLTVLAALLLAPVRVRLVYQGEVPPGEGTPDTGAPEPDALDPFQASVHWLFLAFTLYPAKKKPKHPAKKKPEEPKKESYVTRRLRERGLIGFLSDMANMVRPVPRLTRRLCRHIKLSRFIVQLSIAGEDVAAAAIMTGTISAVLFPLLGALASLVQLPRPQVTVLPDYTRTEPATVADCQIRLRISPWFVLTFAVGLLVRLIAAMLKKPAKTATTAA